MRNKTLYGLFACLILIGITGCQTPGSPSWFGWPFNSSSTNAVATDTATSQPLPSQQAGIPGPGTGYANIDAMSTVNPNSVGSQNAIASTIGPAGTYNPSGINPANYRIAPVNTGAGAYDPNAYGNQVATRPTNYINSPAAGSYGTNTNPIGTTSYNNTPATQQGAQNNNTGIYNPTGTTGQTNPYSLQGGQTGTPTGSTAPYLPTGGDYGLPPNTGIGNPAYNPTGNVPSTPTGIGNLPGYSPSQNQVPGASTQFQNQANQYLQNNVRTTTTNNQYQTSPAGSAVPTATGSPYPTAGQPLLGTPNNTLPYQPQHQQIPAGTQTSPVGTPMAPGMSPSQPGTPYQHNMNPMQPQGPRPSFMPGTGHNELENRNSGGAAGIYSGATS